MLDAVKTEGHVEENAAKVFPEIRDVREHHACIAVTPQTLQSSPDARQTGEEPKQSRARGAAHGRVVESCTIQAKEELNVLLLVSDQANSENRTYPHGVGQ